MCIVINDGAQCFADNSIGIGAASIFIEKKLKGHFAVIINVGIEKMLANVDCLLCLVVGELIISRRLRWIADSLQNRNLIPLAQDGNLTAERLELFLACAGNKHQKLCTVRDRKNRKWVRNFMIYLLLDQIGIFPMVMNGLNKHNACRTVKVKTAQVATSPQMAFLNIRGVIEEIFHKLLFPGAAAKARGKILLLKKPQHTHGVVNGHGVERIVDIFCATVNT